MLDPSVFKAYDVRGIYPTELDEDGAYRIARAYAEQFEPRAVALGHDMRVSSPAMYAAGVEGLADAGADAVRLGLVGTEMLYHAVTELGLDGGICVTASHNPKEYSGMKIVRRGALPVGGDSGLAEIRARAEAGFDASPGARRRPRRGRLAELRRKVLSFVDADAIRPLRVVVDAANGMAGVMLPPVLERLPSSRSSAATSSRTGPPEPRAESAPSREPRVHRRKGEGGRRRPRSRVRRGRRPLLLRRRRGLVRSRRLRHRSPRRGRAREAPGEKVIYDVRASWAVPETIERSGGIPLVNRVGHAFIKQRMRAEDALFAGEVSAHYYFRDFSQADTGVVPFLAHARAPVSRRRPAVGVAAPVP